LWDAVKKAGHSRSSDIKSRLLEDLNAVNQHFADVATSHDYNLDNVRKYCTEGMHNDAISLSEYEVEAMLRKCKKTSAGCDNLPAWLLRSCSYELAGVVTDIFNRSLLLVKYLVFGYVLL